MIGTFLVLPKIEYPVPWTNECTRVCVGVKLQHGRLGSFHVLFQRDLLFACLV